MKSFHFLLSALLLPTFLISSQLKATEALNEEIDFEVSSVVIPESLNAIQEATATPPATAASFRSTRDQTLTAGEKVTFNVVDTNVGKPVKYDATGQQFLVLKEGYYLLSYGVFTTDTTAAAGINLVLVRDGVAHIKHRSLVSDSPTVVLNLKVNDKIRLVSQGLLHLSHGITSTNMTDTAFFTIVRLNQQ